MMRALILYNEVMLDLIGKEKGYKVKSNGDSFLIAFSISVQAVSFCLKAQRGMHTETIFKFELNSI
jgi:hypothetical protein